MDEHALRPPLAPIQPLALLLMLAAMAVAWGLRRSRVRDWWPYFVVSGSLLWLALWRQGIGAALVSAAVHEARRHGLAMTVIANPSARFFYENCGFALEGEAQTRFGPALRMSR